MGSLLVYGDSVVLVRRAQDGTTSRTNAIVLASTVRVPLNLDRKPIKDAKPIEHLDVAFPELSLAPNGQGLKTRNLEEIFRLAYDVTPFEEGKWIGFEVPAVAEAPELVDGQVVPLAQLVDLSNEVSKFDPALEVSPDAVVTSATSALSRACGILETYTEAAAHATKQEPASEGGNQQGGQETANQR